MNEDLEGLERIVEKATAASDAPRSTLEPEAQSLREGWLAFGRLLDAAESATVPRVKLRLPLVSRPCCVDTLGATGCLPASAGNTGRQAARGTPRFRSVKALASRRWPLAVAAALAASLLIGVDVYWMCGGRGIAGSVVSTTDKVASTDVAKSSVAAVKKPSPAATTGDLRWDDSLDQQIAETRQGVALAQSDLAHNFDAIDFVRYGIRQTQQDFEKEKL